MTYLRCEHFGTSADTPSNHRFGDALWFNCLNDLVFLSSADLPTNV